MSILRIGHRGAMGYVAENTLESIIYAKKIGVDGIEIDIFKCLSGELVLSHDKNLKNLTGKSVSIENLTLNELSNFLINKKYKIPTLKSVLESIQPPFLLNIELKGRNTVSSTSKLLMHFVHNSEWQIKDFIISSFNWDDLKKFKSINKNIKVGVLVDQFSSINESIYYGKKINADAIHPHYKLLNEKKIKKIKKNGFKVYTWTVNEKKYIDLMKKYKVDGIISGYPDKI